ncbi:MAG: DUF1028 domain-containing protein [Burkholderiaceae bacterium]
MTWSIVARDPAGQLGIAIASRFFAVGALTMHTRALRGALSTQALMNPLFGPHGLRSFEAGGTASEVLSDLLERDPGRAHRQVHAIGAEGPPAAHTGACCVDWCGHRLEAEFSVAGNMLAGPQVVDATADAYLANPRLPFAARLLCALRAGDAAGGDKRGKQAAALRIQADEEYPQLDLRVDDHPDPIAELARLLDKSLERYQPFVACLPGRRSPEGITDRDEIEARVRAFQAARAVGEGP